LENGESEMMLLEPILRIIDRGYVSTIFFDRWPAALTQQTPAALTRKRHAHAGWFL